MRALCIFIITLLLYDGIWFLLRWCRFLFKILRVALSTSDETLHHISSQKLCVVVLKVEIAVHIMIQFFYCFNVLLVY